MEQENIYIGDRGEDFKRFITNLLKLGNLKNKYINSLTNSESMKQYDYAFTAESADKINNYERFEQIGDVSLNKFLVLYAYRRFPQLDCTKGVKIVARIKINYGSKNVLSDIANDYNFWDYISAQIDGENKTQKYRNRHKKDLLEDCFESFLGCTEYLLDKHFRPGVGYAIVYDILSNIFDKINISLRFEDLYDAKTRLKETVDTFKNTNLGQIKYNSVRQNIENNTYPVFVSYLYRLPKDIPQQHILIGQGIDYNKNKAEQKASEQGIETLKQQGFYREIPEEYNFLCAI